MVSTDRDVLVILYGSTGGREWKQSTNWCTAAGLADWHGVEVNDQGRVVKLSLHDNGLQGSIPRELRALSELRELNLRGNKLTGSIPGELSALAKLQVLDFSYNQLTGSIPGELGALSELQVLKLKSNKLTGSIPGELGALTKLQVLKLFDNELSGSIPGELGALTELQVLKLHNNKLTGSIPGELGALTKLQVLKLCINELSGSIPGELGALTKLQELNVSFNRLTGSIPGELGALTKLQELDVSGNQLTGSIPGELGALTKLQELDVSGNQPTGSIPGDLGALSDLQQLYVSNNQLSGSIPGNLGALSDLQVLDVRNNQLSGSIPKELGNLPYLRSLELDGNQLSVLWDTLRQGGAGSAATSPGTLPVALASLLDMLDRLETLNLDQNPWEHPPEAFVTDGMRAVRGYFDAMYRDKPTTVTRPLKVVIVGKENVGKTSLRRSITAREPRKTREGGEESTVHVDVEDDVVDGQPIRIFDCAGQVVYYGLLQLFLTPRAVYLLVLDAEDASKMEWGAENAPNLESLAIAPWLRDLTFRVPGANVVLVGNKSDLVANKDEVASEVKRQSQEWLASWKESVPGHEPRGVSLEGGVSLVSCAPSGCFALPFRRGRGWRCDKNKPGLLGRITHDVNGDARALTMRLPSSYHLALELLEKLASCRRGEAAPGMTRATMKEKWQARVRELEAAGTQVAAPEEAMSGAILIRKWEGGLVEYGDYIFLDVQSFATVLDPLFSHKSVSLGGLHLGGIRVTNAGSLKRLKEEHILERQLAEEVWGAELSRHLLSAMKSAGLTFPLPNEDGLVILLRMDPEPPADYDEKLNNQLGEAGKAGKQDLRLHVECLFRLGLPPGFVERLLARCCHLGFPYPFWRFGALIVGEREQQGSFSLSLQYSEKSNILIVEVYGGCEEVHPWRVLSKVLSVTMKMLAAFPGLPCEPTFFCPVHKDKGMRIRTTDAWPGSPLIKSSCFCPLCKEREAGKGLLAVGLQVVGFSDEEFFDAQLREEFAENTENVAQWPGPNVKVPGPALSPHRADLLNQVSVPALPQNRANPLNQGSGPALFPNRIDPPNHQDSPWYQEGRAWVGVASAACLTVFGVFAGREDDDSRLWGVFLGAGMLLLGLGLVLIARERLRPRDTQRADAARIGNEHRV